MIDWNGDGRINSMDLYDMIEDTREKNHNHNSYRRSSGLSKGDKYLLFWRSI